MNATLAASTPACSALARWFEQRWFLALWCVVAAFGAYACMYGFRKPFTAGSYDGTEFGTKLKAWLVTAQVLGYTISKIVGIKVIAEMTPARRASAFLGLIGVAQAALLLFAFVPAPWNAVCLFLNGLPLGMVFGLVLGFLEGRRMTELFVAGLCASFILADGATKTVGAWLLRTGVPEPWMPFTAGLVFIAPLAGFVWMLRQIPEPDERDVAARSARAPMTGAERLTMVKRHGVGLMLIVLAYLLITVLRSIRADFAPEIWAGLGVSKQPEVFTFSEMWVALGVVAANGLLFLVRDNRRAFLSALGISIGALALAGLALALQHAGSLPPFAFMVLLGLGMYVPYVAVHTTLFERLVAMTRERGNIGFLMYVADATGYLGYAVVMLTRSAFPARENFLTFFLSVSSWIIGGTILAMLLAAVIYPRRWHQRL
jgi:hypothetical protein